MSLSVNALAVQCVQNPTHDVIHRVGGRLDGVAHYFDADRGMRHVRLDIDGPLADHCDAAFRSGRQ